MEAIYELYSGVNKEHVKEKVKNFENKAHKAGLNNPIVEAIMSQPMTIDELYNIASLKCKESNPSIWLSQKLVEAENAGYIAKYSNGLYGPVVKE